MELEPLFILRPSAFILIDAPRAAAAARFDHCARIPGVFASLGTPGYPPLAAVAAEARRIPTLRLKSTRRFQAGCDKLARMAPSAGLTCPARLHARRPTHRGR